ncbi:hypothetical protein C0991_001650 [Blastosporella zonata]|nr:hypothetical protein C0991_001650 [Blastosporella zonata]
MAGGSAQTAAQQELMRKRQDALRKAAELKQMLDTLEKVDDEGRRSSLLDTLCSNEDILSLPLHSNPPGTKNGDLKVDLLRHQVLPTAACYYFMLIEPPCLQSQALQWCVEREYPTLPKKETDKPVQFWQVRKNGTKRIILDEGHTIRNPKTKMAKAVFGLNAQRRWVLTGTPIVRRTLGSPHSRLTQNADKLA